MKPRASRRRTSKVWLAITLIISFIALFTALFLRLETAAVAVVGAIPTTYGAYVGVGHFDLRQLLKGAKEE